METGLEQKKEMESEKKKTGLITVIGSEKMIGFLKCVGHAFIQSDILGRP